MSFPNATPPSPSSVALWSFKTYSLEEGQPSVAGEDATEAPSPRDSTGVIKSSQQQFPPPEHISISPREQFSNPLPRVNCNPAWDETDHRRGSLSSFVQKRNSVYSDPDPYEAAESVVPPPQHTDVRPRRQSNNILSGVLVNSETVRRGSVSDFVQRRNSVYSDAADPYGGNHETVRRGSVSDFVHRRNSAYPDASPYIDNSLPVDMHSIRGLTVEKRLKLFPVLKVPETTSIFETCCKMTDERADVVALADSNALLCGILTRKDIVERVIASGVDFMSTPVSEVMTKNPLFVSTDTLAMEALQKMEQGEVRQLLGIENGELIGLFRLPSCLFHLMSHTVLSHEYHKVITVARQRVARSNLYFDTHTENRDRGLTVKQLGLPEVLTLPETTTIYQVGCRMAAGRTDVVVLTDANALLSGILTDMDIVERVVATGIDCVNTPASMVMTKNPIVVSSDALPMEALRKMVQGEVTKLPVVENQEVIGVLRLAKCLFDILPNIERTVDAHNVILVAKQRVAQWDLGLKEQKEELGEYWWLL